MIVDYNYKPHVVSPAPGITQYVPASKNNKGVIVLFGVDNLATPYIPDVNLLTPSGTVETIPLGVQLSSTTGSFFDMFMQFRRENPATTTVVRSADITMFPYAAGDAAQTTALTPLFLPITFYSLTFYPTGSPTSWTRPLTIITLY